jgi:excisionase family DNA binding protein
MTDKLAYTIDEAADMIGKPASFVRDLVTARKIRHRRLGSVKGVRFTMADLEAYLDSCIVEPHPSGDVVPTIQRTPRMRRAAA